MKTKGAQKELSKLPVESAESDSDSSIYSDLEEEDSDTSSEEFDEAIDDNEVSVEETEQTTSPKKRKREDANAKKTTPEVEEITQIPDEYEQDSSDEEDLRNTVGNIPLNWYDEYPHIGYDWDGEKILKPTGDNEIDDFLNKIDDPNYWRTIKDKQTGQKVVLDDDTVELISKIQKGRFASGVDMYEPWEDFFTYEKMEHPVSNRPEHKRSFIPSKIEKDKVGKLVHAIKMGWIKPRVPKDDKPRFYMLWDKDTGEVSKRMQHYIAPPKMKLPGHEESYNPPPEYLFNKEEEEEWKSQDPEERKIDFMPQRYSCLRLVPSYSNFIKERFERCLDLYLCPRQRKMRVNVDPNDLLPKLPKPSDLQPFPSVLSIVYTGHKDMVRCICLEPAGQFMASGSDDKTVKIWEVLTGRCLRTIDVESVVHSIAWCPNEALCLLLVAAGNKVYIINPNVGDKITLSNTDGVMKSLGENLDKKIVHWQPADKDQWMKGIRMTITHLKEVHQVVWHAKGDYFASLMKEGQSKSVMVHKLSQAQSQMPFQKLKGQVQCIQFHPLRPFFFVATQRYVRMYNLLKQELSKKLLTNCKWVSSLAIHPKGDNLIIGSYDYRLSWFDLDLSTKPYQTLRYHKKAIRQVAYHPRYPLFASGSDDGSLVISHGMVYSDLLQNPLVVPLKILKGHDVVNNLSILDCCFHPQRPWVFSSGSDSTIRLFT